MKRAIKYNFIKITMAIAALTLYFMSIHCSANPQTTENEICAKIIDNDIIDFSTDTSLEILSSGRAVSNKVIYLTLDEYELLAQKSEIDPEAILVLDQISLKVDLPMIRGLIIFSPLQVEQTHVQALARKMGIPFISTQSQIIRHQILHMAHEQNQFVEFKVTANTSSLNPIHKPLEIINHKKAALPAHAIRNDTLLVSAKDAEHYPRYLVGDKFKPLAQLKNKSPNIVPNIFALSSGFYETYLDTYFYNNLPLRQIIWQQLEVIERARSNDEISAALSTIQHAMRNADSDSLNPKEQVFDLMSATLLKHYPLETSLSIRSNNDIEDLVAAGLFSSSIAKSLRPEDLREAALQVWTSIYSFRSYMIRAKAWNLIERRISMPLLVHEYISNESFNGVAEFEVLPSEEIVGKIQLVHGNVDRATSPSLYAKSHFVFVRKKIGQVDFQISGCENSATCGALKKMIRAIEPSLIQSFNNRRYPPRKVDIEFLLKKNSFGRIKPIVLQYKNTLDRETVLAVNQGEIGREEVESFFEQNDTGKSDDINQLCFKFNLICFDEMKYKFLTQHTEFLNSNVFRYAIIKFKGKYHFVFWRSTLHANVKRKIRGRHTQWIRSGYIAVTGSNNPNPSIAPTLSFTSTTQLEVDNLQLSSNQSTNAFLLAFQSAFMNNPDLLADISSSFGAVAYKSFGQERVHFTINDNFRRATFDAIDPLPTKPTLLEHVYRKIVDSLPWTNL